MKIKTEDFVENLPPKEMTEGIDWFAIYDSFDPTVLDDKYINECARRNPELTSYKWEEKGFAPEPVEKRVNYRACCRIDRANLDTCVSRINKTGLSPVSYRKAREALIKAIGRKGAYEYNRREYERLGEEGRKKQAEEYESLETEMEAQLYEEELDGEDFDLYI